MLHADDGALRRLLDEEWAVPEPVRRHVAECTRCQDRLGELRDLRSSTGRLLASPETSPDAQVALARQLQLQAEGRPARIALPRPWPRASVRWAAGLASFAAILALLTATPVGGYARDLLLIFQPEKFTAVPVTPAQTNGLLGLLTHSSSLRAGSRPGATGGLQSLGIVKQSGNQRLTAEPDLQALQTAVGFAVAVPGFVPGGVGSPSYAALGRVTQNVTLDPGALSTYAAKSHLQIPPVPSTLSGSMLSVTTGPAAVLSYGAPAAALMTAHSLPALVVAQAPVPKVFSTGATVAQIENYMLSLPGVSPELAAEIRAIGDPTSTLPIPVPTGSADATSVSVGAAQGLFVQEANGALGFVVWSSGGYVHLVAGSLDKAQLLRVANGVD